MLRAAQKMAPIIHEYIDEGYNVYVGEPVQAIAALTAWREAGGE